MAQQPCQQRHLRAQHPPQQLGCLVNQEFGVHEYQELQTSLSPSFI